MAYLPGRQFWRTRWHRHPFSRTQTRSEDLLMSALKSNKVKYTYHQVIAGHETDFLLRPNVVVEVDGRVHDRPEVQARDLAINDLLQLLGYKVVRVPNDRVDSFSGADSTAKLLKRMVAEASRNSKQNRNRRY